MKKILILTLLSILIYSCKSQTHSCDAYGKTNNTTENNIALAK